MIKVKLFVVALAAMILSSNAFAAFTLACRAGNLGVTIGKKATPIPYNGSISWFPGIRLTYRRAPYSLDSGVELKKGECTFLDRAIRQDEPNQVWLQTNEPITQVSFTALHEQTSNLLHVTYASDTINNFLSTILKTDKIFYMQVDTVIGKVLKITKIGL